MRKILLEVGVNHAQDTDRLLAEYPDAEYYGFEPTLELYTYLLGKYNGNPRVNLLPFALSNFVGISRFNVAGQADWGCSSLYPFPQDIHQKWPGRADFMTTHSYRVPVVTMKLFLENFIETQGTDYEIVYAWIDAQGSDVLVLDGFGDRIHKLKAGRIEVANSTELYEGTANQVSNAERFLTANGFNYHITPNPDGREADVDFTKV